MAVHDRLDRLRSGFEEAGCDGLLVTELTNVRYLTGFTGSSAQLLVLDDRAVLTTDGRYADQSQAELHAAGVDAEIEIGDGDGQRQALVAAAGGVGRLGLEAGSITWARQQLIGSEWLPETELVPTGRLVEALRRVKDDGEVARIQAAASIADEALAHVTPMLTESPRERDVALDLDTRMRRLGSSEPAFETIVASGPNGARPHHRAGERVIEPGDLVVIDFGATVEGYRSDMTRTFAIGPIDDTRQRMVEVVTESQARGVEAVRADTEARAVDAVCREVIDRAGWGDRFVHSTGHGVGLDIHEEPWVNTSGDATLVAGHVVTVEPGVYLAGIGGVRVEDTVVVTADGCTALTRSPKDPRLA